MESVFELCPATYQLGIRSRQASISPVTNVWSVPKAEVNLWILNVSYRES